LYDEDRLVIAAEELVEREARDAPEAFPLDLEQAEQQLRHFQGVFIAQELGRADREAPPPVQEDRPIAVPPQNRREMLVMEAMGRIRLRQECQHQEWHPVGVRGQSQRGVGQQCDSCHLTLGRYLLECTQCRMRACVRCRRNRL